MEIKTTRIHLSLIVALLFLFMGCIQTRAEETESELLQTELPQTELPQAELPQTELSQLALSARPESVFQVSLLQSLTQGDYYGSITAGELKQNGDIGIGTFDALNGELVMVDGTVYRVAGDGSVEIVPDEETIPFSDVTFFDADEKETIEEIDSFDSLVDYLDGKVMEFGKNRFYVIRIDGTFHEMNVRSELAQNEPYEPLAKVLEHDQTFFDYEDMEGTIVGLYCPPYMRDLNATGWHMHFISEDREKGGHILGLNIESADLSWDYTDGFQMYLPKDKMFSELDLTIDQSEDIAKVEKN